jgi:hypothetical protein
MSERAENAARSPGYTFWQLTLYMLGLGTWGFGGPVALVGYMHRDLVEGRKWISEADYKEGLTLSQLMPRPLPPSSRSISASCTTVMLRGHKVLSLDLADFYEVEPRALGAGGQEKHRALSRRLHIPAERPGVRDSKSQFVNFKLRREEARGV